MCELNLMKVQCVTVNLLTHFHSNNRTNLCVLHFGDGPAL